MNEVNFDRFQSVILKWGKDINGKGLFNYKNYELANDCHVTPPIHRIGFC